MEEIMKFLSALNALSPLAIIGLLGFTLFWIIYKNPFKPIEKSLDEVKSNHLHELPQMASDIGKLVEILQRIEVKMGEDFSYIKARLNGRH